MKWNGYEDICWICRELRKYEEISQGNQIWNSISPTVRGGATISKVTMAQQNPGKKILVAEIKIVCTFHRKIYGRVRNLWTLLLEHDESSWSNFLTMVTWKSGRAEFQATIVKKLDHERACDLYLTI
jgi:hypothetical protein